MKFKSLAVFWSVIVEPPSTQDQLFNPKSPLNRDDCMIGYQILKRDIEANGGECHTLDVFQEKNVIPDAVLFLEVPNVPLEFILGKWTNKVKKYVILYECPVIMNCNWDEKIHSLFDKVFTWNDIYVNNVDYIKINFPNKFPDYINQDITKKERFCTLIAGNKKSYHPLELYSKRVETIRWFEENHPQEFDLYGVGWDKEEFPSYLGKIKNKKEILETYKFAICYENAQMIPGYITEKILDCFFAGCIPVYWGANNISDHIPANCFIDRREFVSHEDLYQYLKDMSVEEYKQYIMNIQEYLHSEQAYQFTPNFFATTIIQAIDTRRQRQIADRPMVPKRNMEIHYLYRDALKYRQHEPEKALQALLKAYNIGKQEKNDFKNYMFIYIEIAFIYAERGELEKAEAFCREGIAIKDQYIDLHCILVQILLKLGNEPEAIKSCLRYMELVDNYANIEKDGYVTDLTLINKDDIMHVLAQLFFRAGQDEKALELIERIKTVEYIKGLLIQFTQLYLKSGKYEQLKDYYEKHVLLADKQFRLLYEEQLVLVNEVYQRQEKKWGKKILLVGMQWDYGQCCRGFSGEKLWFYDTICSLVRHVETFWYDDYLTRIEELQDAIIKKANEVKPDLIIFIPYKDQFSFATLDVLREKYATYAWFGDDQWRFDQYSVHYAPHYTYVSTTDPWSIGKYKDLGISPILTQWAGRLYSDNIGPLHDGEVYEYDVSFVGGCSDYRRWFVEKLQQEGIDVRCFGAGWSNERITFKEMENIFRKSKINLNISNSANNDIRFVLSNDDIFERWKASPKKAEQVKARNFEVPLAGGFQLSNYVLGLERYFHIGEELIIYTTPEECSQHIKYFLNNEEERQKILLQSHKRAMQEHTYSHRLSKILEEIWL